MIIVMENIGVVGSLSFNFIGTLLANWCKCFLAVHGSILPPRPPSFFFYLMFFAPTKVVGFFREPIDCEGEFQHRLGRRLFAHTRA